MIPWQTPHYLIGFVAGIMAAIFAGNPLFFLARAISQVKEYQSKFMNEKREWHRRRGESAQAYAAATTYFELGPQQSIVAAAKSSGKSTSLLEKWSSKYKWVERAAAFNANEDRKRLEALAVHITSGR